MSNSRRIPVRHWHGSETIGVVFEDELHLEAEIDNWVIYISEEMGWIVRHPASMGGTVRHVILPKGMMLDLLLKVPDSKITPAITEKIKELSRRP